jgi:hypothetical protein
MDAPAFVSGFTREICPSGVSRAGGFGLGCGNRSGRRRRGRLQNRSGRCRLLRRRLGRRGDFHLLRRFQLHVNPEHVAGQAFGFGGFDLPLQRRALGAGLRSIEFDQHPTAQLGLKFGAKMAVASVQFQNGSGLPKHLAFFVEARHRQPLLLRGGGACGESGFFFGK